MAGKSRELIGKRTGTRSTKMKDKYGNILTQRDEVIRREREENVKKLYGNTRGKKPDFGNVIPGPPILRCEVEKALRRMKWGKAEGSNSVVAEMVEAARNFATAKLTDLANKLRSTGNIPERMTESEFIARKEQQSVANIGKSAS